MTPTERTFSEPMYFVTAAVAGWKHLFANRACARILFDSLAHLGRTGKLRLYAFALLPSHLHLIGRPLGRGMPRLMEDFADFTAARMASALRRRGRGPLMHYLYARSDGRPGAPVWGELRLEEIHSREKLAELLTYMHNKPLSTRWRLAVRRGDYQYSSACFYDEGREPIVPVADARKEWGTGGR
jgi:putative transposase